MALTLKNLVNIFAAPMEVFEELRQKPKWIVAFLIISLLTIAIGFLSLPFTRQPVLQAISRGGALEGVRLMAVVNLLLLHVKGAGSIHHITDLQAIIGLDFLMEDKTSDLATFTVLNAVHIFNIWYIVVLSIGLRVMSGLGNIKSAILVTSVWLLGVGFQVAMAVLSANMQRLQSG